MARRAVAFGGDDVVAVDENAPGHRLVEADHVLEQRALAAARTAKDDEDLAAIDGEVDVVHQHLAVVAGGEVLDADDRIGGHA